MPSLTCASTSTRRGSRPTRAWVTARASTLPTLRGRTVTGSVRACARQAHLRSTRRRDGPCGGSRDGAAARRDAAPPVQGSPGRGCAGRSRRSRVGRRGPAPQRRSQARARSLRVRVDRSARRSRLGGAELELARVVEAEQLIRVAVLLVVVDQARIRRRRDDAVERRARTRPSRESPCTTVAAHASSRISRTPRSARACRACTDAESRPPIRRAGTAACACSTSTRPSAPPAAPRGRSARPGAPSARPARG